MSIGYKNPHSNAKKSLQPYTNKNKRLTKLSDYGKKDTKWDVKKYNSTRLENVLYRSIYPTHRNYGKRMSCCGNRITFRGSVNKETGQFVLNLSSAFFCHFRHCPVCDWRRSLRSQAMFKNALPTIIDNNPRARWLFLTLTVENCHITELRETIREMNRAYERMIKRKAFSFIKGWIRKVEVTQEKNRKDFAHPHFHCLIMVNESYFKNKSYLSFDKWVDFWSHAMRSEIKLSVDVQSLRKKFDVNDESIIELLKTFNYSVKTRDIVQDKVTQEWFYEYINQVHALKFLTSGGELKNIFRELKESDETDEELINVDDAIVCENLDEDELDVELNFDYRSDKRKYIKV